MTNSRVINHLIFWPLMAAIFVVAPILNHLHWVAIYAAHGVK